MDTISKTVCMNSEEVVVNVTGGQIEKILRDKQINFVNGLPVQIHNLIFNFPLALWELDSTKFAGKLVGINTTTSVEILMKLQSKKQKALHTFVST